MWKISPKFLVNNQTQTNTFDLIPNQNASETNAKNLASALLNNVLNTGAAFIKADLRNYEKTEVTFDD